MKTKDSILIVAIATLALGCNHSNSGRVLNTDIPNCELIDFEVDSITDSTFVINWGPSDDMKHMTRVFSNYEVLNVTETERTSSKIFLLLSSGQNNNNGLLLDLTTDTTYYFSSILGSDIRLGIVAHKDSIDCKVRFQNILNNKVINVICEDPCPAIQQSDCIKKVCFTGNSAFVIWEGMNWSANNNDYRLKEVDLSEIIEFDIGGSSGASK
jgi:hypothetical protein